jgi:hypothetical protein
VPEYPACACDKCERGVIAKWYLRGWEFWPVVNEILLFVVARDDLFAVDRGDALIYTQRVVKGALLAAFTPLRFAPLRACLLASAATLYGLPHADTALSQTLRTRCGLGRSDASHWIWSDMRFEDWHFDAQKLYLGNDTYIGCGRM